MLAVRCRTSAQSMGVGFDTGILPYVSVNSWSLYMTYLQEYYKRNSPEVLACQVESNAASGPNLNGDDGNDVASRLNLVSSCLTFSLQNLCCPHLDFTMCNLIS
jgi:hypothetical protein